MSKPQWRVRRVVATLAMITVLGACKETADDPQPPAPGQPQGSPAPAMVDGVNVSMNTLSCNDVVDMTNVDPNTFLLQRSHVIERAFGERLISTANEAHDCQSVITSRTDTLTAGPLLTVWAFASLRSIDQRDVPVPVAGVFVEGVNVDLQALNVPAAKSCIWVQANAGGDWRSWVAPAAESGCGTPSLTDSTQSLIGAKAFRVSRVEQADLGTNRPVGARIIDLPGRQYRIGFQCGNRWCVTMAPDSAPLIENIPLRSAGIDRQRLYKWENGRLIRTTLDSEITPDPTLIKKTKLKDWDQGFIRVATIEFTNLDQANPADIRYYENKIGLRPLPRIVHVEMSHKPTSALALDWEMRYNGTSVKKAHWMRSDDAPGQAKWKFSLRDEGVWVSCPFGCCGDQ